MAHEVPLLQSRQPVTNEDRMTAELFDAGFYRECARISLRHASRCLPGAARMYLNAADDHMDRARAHYSNAIGWASK